MGIYIKGVTRSQLMKALICSTEFLGDDLEIVEVKEPHGRLIDEDELEIWEDEVRYRHSAPTVIEAEGE